MFRSFGISFSEFSSHSFCFPFSPCTLVARHCFWCSFFLCSSLVRIASNKEKMMLVQKCTPVCVCVCWLFVHWMNREKKRKKALVFFSSLVYGSLVPVRVCVVCVFSDYSDWRMERERGNKKKKRLESIGVAFRISEKLRGTETQWTLTLSVCAQIVDRKKCAELERKQNSHATKKEERKCNLVCVCKKMGLFLLPQRKSWTLADFLAFWVLPSTQTTTVCFVFSFFFLGAV